MTLVNDNVGEIVFRVECCQEIGIAVFVFDAERLVRGDMDTGVLGVVRAVRLSIDLCGVSAKDILERLERLRAEFVAVADKESAGELACVGDSFQQVYGDECLACSGSQGQKSPFRLVVNAAKGDLFHDGANGCILIVAAGTFTAGIRLQQWPCCR